MESGTVHLNLRTVLLTMMMFKWGTLCSASSDRCLSAPCQNGATCVDDMDDYACLCPRDELRYMGKDCHELYDACTFGPCEDCTSIPGTTEYHCTCPDGLAGDNCTEEVDECQSGPCSEPRAACIDQLNGYFCRCPDGYGGEDCQNRVTDCVDEPCENNGTCVPLPDGFLCRCAPGFVGEACEEDVDECASHPCQNGAICVDGWAEFHCFCVPGFQGYNCEMDINECASRPCDNNATCINGRDHYQCECLVGFEGVNCEMEIDECESSPCLNGATCHDLIGEYTCDCVDGFDGTRCEVDVDECASDPCQNGAVCHDMVNSYECDCGDTGFMGTHCEEDILECASDPCHHGATCLEGVKHYICLCWPGYEGEHCETDVDECVDAPCENGGECFQRSDPSTWEEADWEVHYANAAGYICQCQPGYAGENCSVDIDECESEPCQNGATCEDHVNGYTCTCSPGFTGDMCEVNIDECQSQPCANDGQCEDGVASYTCHCPEPEPGSGDLPWGGERCEVRLRGCVDHSCQNGATCHPWLQESEADDHHHSHDCICAHGFHDEHCSTPTTFSLRALGFIHVETAPEQGEEREAGDAHQHHDDQDDADRSELGDVRLRFRTTLPDMVLFYRGDAHNHMLLEIQSGSLHAKARSEDVELSAVLPEPVVDGGWWDTHVLLEGGSLLLMARGPGCDQPPGCRVIDTVDPDGPTFHPDAAFADIYVAGVPEDFLGLTATGASFIGCMEDLLIDHRAILPHELPQDDQTMELGCSKTEWCSPDPCSGNGRCVDLWTSYRCDCYRPYHGESCSDEFPSWTYSHEDLVSFSSYVVAEGGSGGVFSVSLFLRSLKPDGLLFQLRRHAQAEEEEEGGEVYFSLYLGMGRVFVSSLANGIPVTAPIFMTTGEKRFLQVDVQHGQVFFQQGDLRYAIGSVPEVEVAAGDVAYVGGLPGGWSSEPWGGTFKGCLQDLRLDAVHLEVEPGDGAGEDEEEVHSDESENVTSGCVSDDTCKEDPCLNGGQCGITFNDFTCLCPEEYTGKTCEMRVWCVSDPCVNGGYCIDLADGYECVQSATFENNPVLFSAEGTLVDAVTSLYVEMRTRSENAVLLRATRRSGSGGSDLLMLGLLDSSVHVEVHGANSVEPLVFTGRRHVSDGSWHRVSVTSAAKTGSEVVSGSRWVITVDGITDTSGVDPAGPATAEDLLAFLNEEDAVVAVGDSLAGCLGAVRLGGVYLPYVDDRRAPQTSQFHIVGDGKVDVGCTSAPVCDSNPCQNAATCEDLFNAYGCVCHAGWEGERCEVDTDDCASQPCGDHGTCEDLLAGFHCVCHAGYGGELCDADLDECERNACQNGGGCVDGPNSYTCLCPEQYSGPLCQWDYPPLQCGTDVRCDNDGVCTDGPWGANCSCVPGFAGDSCETEVDECASNPCRNGGSCLDRLDKFLCLCTPGYIGPMCDTNKRAQRDRAPWLVVAIPLACLCVLVVGVAVTVMALTARKKRQSEGAYSPSAQELAGARLEMDSMLKVPPEERLI